MSVDKAAHTECMGHLAMGGFDTVLAVIEKSFDRWGLVCTG
jgi:hypothetical protein